MATTAPWSLWPVLANPWGPGATVKPYGLQPQHDTPLGISAEAGKVQELFASVQGEGLLVGVRQAFLRLAHCHLHCAYCDTTMTTPSGGAYLQGPANGNEVPVWYVAPNPLSADTVLACLEAYHAQAPLHSLSLTGGEPLLQAVWLADALLPALKQALPTVGVYLETSGTQPWLLSRVLAWLTIVAMDYKLASSTGQPCQHQVHTAFAQQSLEASHHPHVLIKVVVNETTQPHEIEGLQAWGRTLTSQQQQRLTVVVQPETRLELGQGLPPYRGCASQWQALQALLLSAFVDVRIVPQVHKSLQVS
jgi:7-carboxy-7-deazaguanine synthase